MFLPWCCSFYEKMGENARNDPLTFSLMVSLQEERAVRDRSLLQVQDHDQPILWKVQFNLGNSSRPSNQCRNSIQGKHLITDELGRLASFSSCRLWGAPLWPLAGFLSRDFTQCLCPSCSCPTFLTPLSSMLNSLFKAPRHIREAWFGNSEVPCACTVER